MPVADQPQNEPDAVLIDDQADDAAELNLSQLVRLMADDASRYASAQMDWVRAEAGERSSLAVPALGLVMVAVVLAFGSLVSAQVGLIWLLVPQIGPGWATLSVVGGSLLISAILLKIGTSRIKKAFRKPELP
jgi:protein-S-isoprenylcysteine O-methyltransferase Ste14